VVMHSPTWDPAWFESTIVNLGLNLSFSYYGGNMYSRVLERRRSLHPESVQEVSTINSVCELVLIMQLHSFGTLVILMRAYFRFRM